MRFYGIFLICVFVSGCAALLTEQKYIRIDAPVTVTKTRKGTVYAIPEKKLVRKIRILGKGTVKNIEIWIRDDAYNWKSVKKIKRGLVLPADVEIPVALTLPTNAVRILQRTKAYVSIKGGQSTTGQINTVEFYTVE